MVDGFLCGTNDAFLRVDRFLPSSTVDPLLWAYWTDSNGKKNVLVDYLLLIAICKWKIARQVLVARAVLSLFFFFSFLLSSSRFSLKDRSQNISTIWRESVYSQSWQCNDLSCWRRSYHTLSPSFEAMVRPRRQRDVPDGSSWGSYSCTLLYMHTHSPLSYTQWLWARHSLALFLFQRIKIAL